MGTASFLISFSPMKIGVASFSLWFSLRALMLRVVSEGSTFDVVFRSLLGFLSVMALRERVALNGRFCPDVVLETDSMFTILSPGVLSSPTNWILAGRPGLRFCLVGGRPLLLDLFLNKLENPGSSSLEIS